MASESGFLFFGGDLIATTVDMLETGVISVAPIGRAAISSTFDTSSRPNDEERSYAKVWSIPLNFIEEENFLPISD